MQKDADEEIILKALRENPHLKACVLEMVDITDGESFEELNSGDDAEEAVIQTIRKTGQALLQSWIEKKNTKVIEEIQSENLYRAHKKKAHMANHSRQDRASTTNISTQEKKEYR